jgi:predicted Zn-dependent peptidase
MKKIIILASIICSAHVTMGQQKVLKAFDPQPPKNPTATLNNQATRTDNLLKKVNETQPVIILADPMHTQLYTLPNGLKVYLTVNNNEPKVQTLIAVKTGSKNDPSDHTGLSHYLEHMLFKGTDLYGSKDFAKEKPLLLQIENLYEQYGAEKDEQIRKKIYHQIDSVSGLAAQYAIANEYDKMLSSIAATGTNAFTSTDMTVYVNEIPSNQINKWLQIEAERFRNPQMRLFHTELEAVYEEKNRGLDNDDRKATEAMMAALFKNHTYGTQTTIGTIEHLKSPSIKAILKYYYERYVPNNMAIIISGDIDPVVLIEEIKTSFGYMQAKPLVNYTFLPETPRSTPEEVSVFGPDAESLTMAYRLKGTTNSNDYFMQQIIASLLSNSAKAGLLDMNLLQQQKVLKASAGIWANTDYTIFMLDAKARKEQTLQECRALLLQELNKLTTGDFDESLIAAVVANMKTNELRTLESNAGKAYAIQNIFIHDINYVDYVNRFNYLETITKADVMAFCKDNFTNDYVIVYKKQGEDKNVKKVEKPSITPVSVNRDDQSKYVKNLNGQVSPAILPVFIDYSKAISILPLYNNTPLWYIKNTENELFSLFYVFDMGTLNDKKLSLAIEYFKYLGTAQMTADEISKTFYKLACKFNVSIGKDMTYITLNGPQKNMEPALALLESLINNSVVNNEKLPKIIDGIIKERADNKKNKNAIRSKLLDYANFGAINPSNFVLNNEELKNITAQELVDKVHGLKNYPHKVYYYGPATNTTAVEIINQHHITSPVKTEIAQPINLVRNNVSKSMVYFVNYPMVQAEVSWTRKAVDFDLKIQTQSEIFNEYFGGSMSSIVFQTIRESKALAYATSARFNMPSKKEDPFYMTAYVGTQADKFNDAVKGMNELLTTLPMSATSFETAKEALQKQIETNRTLKTDIFFSYQNALKYGVNYDTDKNLYEQLSKSSLTDVDTFYKKYIQGQAFNYCIVANKEKVPVADMQKLGEVLELSLESIFGY